MEGSKSVFIMIAVVFLVLAVIVGFNIVAAAIKGLAFLALAGAFFWLGTRK